MPPKKKFKLIPGELYKLLSGALFQKRYFRYYIDDSDQNINENKFDGFIEINDKILFLATEVKPHKWNKTYIYVMFIFLFNNKKIYFRYLKHVFDVENLDKEKLITEVIKSGFSGMEMVE